MFEQGISVTTSDTKAEVKNKYSPAGNASNVGELVNTKIDTRRKKHWRSIQYDGGIVEAYTKFWFRFKCYISYKSSIYSGPNFCHEHSLSNAGLKINYQRLVRLELFENY